jgi:hypothetical protein
VETALGHEGKTIGLPLIRNQSFFYSFPFGFTFTEICRVHHFNLLNSILIKNLKNASSFLEFFISKFLKFSNSPARLPKTGETGPGRFLWF